MKKLLPFLSLILILNHASAALPFYDPFADATGTGGTAYAIDSTLAGQTNSGNAWESIGTTNGTIQPVVFPGNLSYQNLPSSTGNSVLIPSAAEAGARLNIHATNTTGRAYYSLIMQVTNLDNVPTDPSDNWFSAFGDGSGAQLVPVQRIGGKILTKRSGDGYVIGAGKTRVTSTYLYDSHVYSLNESVFVVVAYEQLAGVATNELMWINPAPSSFGAADAPAPDLTVSTPGAPADGVLNTGGVRSFILASQNATAPTVIVDELRIGTNWSSVVPVTDPSILQNPSDQTVPPGGNATFTVQAAGTPGLTYQWFKNGTIQLNDGGNISGATSDTLHVNNVTVGDVGTYSVVVTNGLGNTVQSTSAHLNLSDPAISAQPESRTNDYGTTATFTISVSGTEPFNYQWHKEGVGDLSDGGNISGSQTATLTIDNVAYPDSGNYYVTVGNSKGSTNSTMAALTVIDPVIMTSPESSTNNPGETVMFHVVANGSGPLSYQWYKNGTQPGNAIFDIGNLSGTATDTLTVSDVSAADEGDYIVLVVGAYNTIQTSDSAHLKVLSPVEIAVQPVSRTIGAGATVSFAVKATGSDPFFYQWFFNGTNAIADATSSSLTITNAQLADAGAYSVSVSNSVNSISSSSATLTISTNLQLFETNLVVVRVGDAGQTLSVNGNSIFLDQFDPNGNYVNTVNVPDDGAKAMVAIGWDNINGINSGSTTGTSLTRSLDGRFMVVAGYNTNLNYGADLSVSASTDVPRAIGLINSHAQYSMPVASTDSIFSKTYWRAAVTDGTNNFWGVSGVAGTYYFGFDAPGVLVQNTFINSRSMGLFNGNIYCATAASPTGILKIDGMPTNAVTPTVLFNDDSGTYDLVVSPDGNTIYVADQRNVTANPAGGIHRYDFNGTSWSLTYNIKNGFGTLGPRYITADFSGPNAVLYVTSNDQSFDNNRIIKVVDTGADSTGTTLAYAGMNQTFRGIHFGPVASAATIERPTLLISGDQNNVILNWDGAFTLQSSTNVAGPYEDISTATSPYTNQNSSSQLFFRLHQSGE